MIDIHADDYGYSINTSKDILECVKTGNLDSFSIICNMPHFEECMELLYKEIPNLPYLPKMSIHINLVEGVFEDNTLPMTWPKLFLSSYGFNRSKMKEIYTKEITSQIEKTWPCIKKCIKIAKENKIKCKQKYIRIDSHMHTHLIPVVWEGLIESIANNKYKVEYIRNPKEPIMPFIKVRELWPTYNVANIIKNRLLMFYSNKVDKYCDNHDIDKMYMCGLMMSGHMDYDRINKLFPLLKKDSENNNRCLELLFHPGLALKKEHNKYMNKGNYETFNSSKNRHIEKNAVLNIKKVVG